MGVKHRKQCNIWQLLKCKVPENAWRSWSTGAPLLGAWPHGQLSYSFNLVNKYFNNWFYLYNINWTNSKKSCLYLYSIDNFYHFNDYFYCTIGYLLNLTFSLWISVFIESFNYSLIIYIGSSIGYSCFLSAKFNNNFAADSTSV